MPNRKPVSLAEGEKIFNDYYDKKHKKKPLSQYKAKLFDKLYSKKKRKNLQPDSKESYKYRFQEGVKNYDLEGVDGFKENTTFTLRNDVTGDIETHTSKGTSIKHRPNDPDDIGGPRLGKRGEPKGPTYIKHFKEEYDKNTQETRKSNKKKQNSPRTNKNLINLYWEKFNSRILLEDRLQTYDLSQDDINKTLDILSNEILGFKKYSYKNGKKK